MYEELIINFKDGSSDSYSPLQGMKLERSNDKIIISYYGTLVIHKEEIELQKVEFISINSLNEDDDELVSEDIVFNESIDNIIEFDNLEDSTYGIFR